MAREVKFSEWMTKGFDIYKNNLGILILASLIMLLLSAVTCGVLVGPLTAGFILLVFALMDGKSAEVKAGDIFKGFDYFLQTFLLFLVWGLISFAVCAILGMIPILGQIASMAASYVLSTLIMFAVFLIVDKGMDFWPASMASIELVKQDFWPLLGFVAVAGIISGAGALLCGIGIIATMPIYWTFLAVAYREYACADQAPKSDSAIEVSAVEVSKEPSGDESSTPSE